MIVVIGMILNKIMKWFDFKVSFLLMLYSIDRSRKELVSKVARW